MSNFRDRAAEIKAAGEAERGNFTPHGVPLRIYSWWLENSVSNYAGRIKRGQKENFCHFWRVVAIWAPLLWSFRALESFATSKTGLTTMLAVAAGALLSVLYYTNGWLDFLMGTGLVAGIFITVFVLGYLLKKAGERWKMFLPVALIVTLSLFPIIILTALVLDFGFIALAYVAAVLIGVGMFTMALHMLVTYISGRRSLHNAEYQKRVDDYIQNGGTPPWELDAEPGPLARKVAAFFRGVGDFLILASQIVRVKKWKICPMVEIRKDA